MYLALAPYRKGGRGKATFPGGPPPPPGRRGGAGVEAEARFLAPPPALAFGKRGAIPPRRPADLADHDDRLGLFVGEEHLQDLDEIGALDRIAADTDGGGLP